MSFFCSKNKYDSKFSKFVENTQSKLKKEEVDQRIKEAKQELDEQEKKSKIEAEQAKQKIQDTHNINLKEHFSEASSRLRSVHQATKQRVSGILEMRKQLFNKEKKEEMDKIAHEQKAQDARRPPDDQDKAAAAPEGAPAQEEQAKQQANSEPRPSRLATVRARVAQTTSKINEKAPFVYKTGVFFKDLWRETFPNDEGNVKTRLAKRRDIAKMQANYTPEEIEAMQENIPDWKRTAVSVVDEQAKEEENSSYLIKLYRKVGHKVSDSVIANKIIESEEYKDFKKKYREIKIEAKDLKEDFKDEVETTQNPVVGTVRTVGDYLFQETTLCQAITKMKEFDPEFDIMDLHYEIEEVFIDLFDNFLKGDLEYLQKI
eukprot:CAMPEP_0168356342 /NCGR_PEP_ID=MMETSP0213-20121227/25093_1 /TAXON_ID=151035 /ORGANISM="Euplotes harpa, Strain FSP1.4" /LENGTH=373 /DNA_ID=CAMNT_0008368733 /DNA_START=64 /DNA_END=1186 /DNA_ORIENTATION=-